MDKKWVIDLNNTQQATVAPSAPTAAPSMQQQIEQQIQAKGAPNTQFTPPPSPPPTQNKGIQLNNIPNLVMLGLFIGALFMPILPRQIGGEAEIKGATANNEAIIRSTVNGIVDNVFVQTNQPVKAGDALASLKNWTIEEKIVNIKEEIEQTKASIGTLKAQSAVGYNEYQSSLDGYKQQKIYHNYLNAQADGSAGVGSQIDVYAQQMQKAQIDIDNTHQKSQLYSFLAEQGALPKQMALQASFDAKAAEEQKNIIESQKKVAKSELTVNVDQGLPKLGQMWKGVQANKARLGVIGSQTQEKLSQINSLNDKLNFYLSQKEALILKSPIDGVVVTPNLKALNGQNLNPGDVAMVVDNLSKVNLQIELPEEQRLFVKEGDKVTIRIRSIKGKKFESVVESISPITIKEDQQNAMNKRKIWQITTLLSNPDNSLKPGMTGFSKIHTGSKNSIIGLVWDEVYNTFRLDRYM